MSSIQKSLTIVCTKELWCLYRFTAFFAYMYLSFTVITGAFNHHVENFPNALHIVNGVVEAAQITMQIVFVIELKSKVGSTERRRKKKREGEREINDLNFI